jgi:hypothetical protein
MQIFIWRLRAAFHFAKRLYPVFSLGFCWYLAGVCAESEAEFWDNNVSEFSSPEDAADEELSYWGE